MLMESYSFVNKWFKGLYPFINFKKYIIYIYMKIFSKNLKLIQ